MSGSTKKTRAQIHKSLRKKIGKSGFKNHEDFEKSAGLFECQNITVQTLREKAWKRI
jgi:hypothetical protein